jgi:predicted acyltransferase
MTADLPPAAAQTKPERLLSLDAFRGLVIVVMFLVNVGGNDAAFPSWFPHRGWADGHMGNGLADYVFPCFLFIVGAAVPLSMRGGRGKDQASLRRIAAAFWRGTRLYLLGTLLICASIAYTTPLTVNVLARWDILPLIGFAYFMCVVLHCTPKAVQAAFVAGVLAFKWVLLTQLKLPGHDSVVWTATENYQAYLRTSWGWWGTAVAQGLPAAAECMFGAWASSLLLAGERNAATVQRLFLRGVIMIGASYVWHAWGGFPYSKDFFTSSYVIVAGGVSCCALAACYWLVDVRTLTTLEPLRVIGTNALAVYVLAEFLWRTSMMHWKMVTPDGSDSILVAATRAWMQHWTTPTLGSWLHVAAYIALYWLVARALYRRGWFIKV